MRNIFDNTSCIILACVFILLLQNFTPADINTTTITLPENKLNAAEHRWTIRMLHYHPSPMVPRRMYFSASKLNTATPAMDISLTIGGLDTNQNMAMLMRTTFNKATEKFEPILSDYRIFPEFSEGHGIAASADGSIIGMMVRRPNGTSNPGSFDKDLLIGHNWEKWITPTMQQPACTTEAKAIDEMWVLEWTGGDIQAAPKKYIVHKSIGSWEYGNNYLKFGENDNSYGIAVKAMVFDGGCGAHEADAFLIMDRSDHTLTTRGWSWACGTGHTMSNYPAYNPILKKYGMLCCTDYNEGQVGGLGAIFFHMEDGPQNEFHLFNVDGLRQKGGSTTLLPEGDGYIGILIGINGEVIVGGFPHEPPTSLGLARFDADGNQVDSITWVVELDQHYVSYPQLVPLGDGKYLLGYGKMTDLNGDDWYENKYRIPMEFYVMEIDSTGNPLTQPQALDSLGWGEQDQLVSLGDGYVGWAYIPDPRLRSKDTLPPCTSNTFTLAVYKSGAPYIIHIPEKISINHTTLSHLSSAVKFMVSVHNETYMNISIYNMKGRKVKQLFDNRLGRGEHTIQWDKTDDSNRKISSGIYFYRIALKDKAATNIIRKLTIFK
jgi:hypothetical protein